MNNKEQIAGLEKTKVEMYESFKKAEETYISALEVFNGQIEKLKKDDEVKPVFPEVDGWHIDNFSVYKTKESSSHGFIMNLGLIGMTFNSEEDARAEVERMTARAYVIEAINKANGGDNGFKFCENNSFCEYCHHDEIFTVDDYEGVQSQDPWEYFRRNADAYELLKSDEFVAALKTVKGIK